MMRSAALPSHSGGTRAIRGVVFTGRQASRMAAGRTPASRFVPCVIVAGRSVEVRVNDRGTNVKGLVVDESTAAAKQLGMMEKGLARVRLYRCADKTG